MSLEKGVFALFLFRDRFSKPRLEIYNDLNYNRKEIGFDKMCLAEVRRIVNWQGGQSGVNARALVEMGSSYEPEQFRAQQTLTLTYIDIMCSSRSLSLSLPTAKVESLSLSSIMFIPDAFGIFDQSRRKVGKVGKLIGYIGSTFLTSGSRAHQVLQASQNGGKLCTGNLTLVRGCKAAPCPVEAGREKKQEATRNKCIASSNKCLTSQRKFSVQNFRVTDIQQLFNHHSSYTTHHTPLIIHHSSYTTHHTPLITHHSSYTTHHTLLIIHHSSYTTHHTPLIIHHSSFITCHTPLIIHQSSYTAHTPALVSTAQAPGNSSSRCRFLGRCSTL